MVELRDSPQRRAPQRLGVMDDVKLPVSLKTRHSAIEGGDKLTQVVDKCLS